MGVKVGVLGTYTDVCRVTVVVANTWKALSGSLPAVGPGCASDYAGTLTTARSALFISQSHRVCPDFPSEFWRRFAEGGHVGVGETWACWRHPARDLPCGIGAQLADHPDINRIVDIS